MSKKILILGANGMAGHVLTIGLRKEKDLYNVISVARKDSIVKPSILLDVTNFKELETLISSLMPDIIINCVGLLNKTAEENPDKAILINSYLPHFLESITRLGKTKVIHISTDCVFSGIEGNYNENSFKNGIGYYAQTKAIGEIINKKDLTLRTSIIGPEINHDGIGLFHWFSKQKGQINGYSNVIWTGVTTIELLNAIKSAISEDLCGLYHLVNDKKISKYNLLDILNHEFNRNYILVKDTKYKIDKSLVNNRTDFSFKVNEYKDMILNLKLWIQNNKSIYPHYIFD
jgi:dTDP-4-dehydrorhamnose reductase